MEKSKHIVLKYQKNKKLPFFIIFIADYCFICKLKQSSAVSKILLIFCFRGLRMPKCRSPPFFCP